MAHEGGGQEGFFWDSYPWVMSNKSSGTSGFGDKNLIDPSKGCEMTQPKMRDTSGGDEQVVATTVDNKRTFDDFKMKKEDEVNPNDKGKRELEPNDHDLHIWTERERRKKMRNMFHQLHALIPQLPPKADKTSIVDEAVSYIKTLEKTLQKLETKKMEKLYGALSNTTIIGSPISPQTPAALNTRESFLADQSSSTSPFGMISPANSSSYSFPAACSPTVFQTWASSNVTVNVCGVDAHISICSSPKPGLATAICLVLEKHKLEILSAQIFSDHSKILFMIHAHANTPDQFGETFHHDDVYKQAATEIMHWVNSKSS